MPLNAILKNFKFRFNWEICIVFDNLSKMKIPISLSS